MIYYAVKHKKTEAFLSALWMRGGTYWEGEADEAPPRLFATRMAAQKFVEMWAKGQAYTKEGEYRTFYDDQGRSRSDLLIVPLSLSEV